MKVVVSETTYTDVANIRFAPQVDLCGLQGIVDKFSADIYTLNTITPGQAARLYDDDNNLYMSGIVQSVQKREDGMVSIECQHSLAYLDEKKVPARFYANVPLSTAVIEVTAGTLVVVRWTSTTLDNAVINGFAPEQTGRERLTWLAFACNAFIRTSYTYTTEFVPLPASAISIPFEHTYWKPTVIKGSFVSQINLTYFSFVRDEDGDDPDAERVTDGNGVVWKVTRTPITVSDPNIPVNAPTSEVTIDNMMLLHSGNYATILSTLTSYYFGRQSVEADVINDRISYVTGNKVNLYLSEEEIATGFIESMDYAFGLRTKSRIRLGACVMAVTGGLVVNYISMDSPPGQLVIAKKKYYFPVGYVYTIQTEYVDVSIGGYEYVFRPATPTISGTMASGSETVTVNCYVALRKNYKTGILEVISVDAVDNVEHTEGEDTYNLAEID